ncbi:putative transcription factor interactor and regulator CCHC(Zn) family [Helianthus annuus]|nr:putative transcription factor interactor and regulator CCHC(Zn) family [Helianthus annuus]KAJ0633438.1 putative transcription factor interactor and regulator CCHC(Zn) family [Helianthus annuus]KAJ0827577.1 putative transcription factor interactor and regulator CCHC(Zn) family [Helianthus annuus]
MVTPLDKAIERYIDGLPDSVQDIVTGSKPTTVRQAIELSATLTESQIRKGKLHRKGDKKGKKQDSDKKDSKKGKNKKGSDAGSSKGSRKRKASQNYAVTTQAQTAQNQPTQQPAKRPYLGNAPLCNRCNGHHQPHLQCRQCTNCGRPGHLAATCRIPANLNRAAQNPAQQVAQPLAQQQGQAV